MEEIKFPKFKNYIDQKVNFIQPKLDGHLCKIYKNQDDWFAYTKNDKEITEKLLAIDHISNELQSLPCRSVIFGEMHCPDVFASSVPTMLNDSNEDLQLTVFAAPLLGGENCFDRNLVSIMEQLNTFKINASFATPVIHDFINEAAKEVLLKQAKQKGLEGWVLKESHMTGWYKLKPVQTIDAFVTKTYESSSDRHRGGLKCIRVGVWDGEKIHDLGTAGNGFKLEYRMQYNSDEKRNELLNKVCEIAYDSVTAGKKLRFPRFIRWRDDKNIQDCTVEQLGE